MTEEQLQINNTDSCISQLKEIRDIQRLFNNDPNNTRRPFGSFVTKDYETLKSQLQPLNLWNWDDLAEQIKSYPKYDGNELTVLVWNVYVLAYVRNGPVDFKYNLNVPRDVEDVIRITNHCFLLDLTEDTKEMIDGDRGNFLLSRVHPSFYLPKVHQVTVDMIESEYGFCFFKLRKYEGFKI